MATKGEKGFFEEWPDWSKPTMALAAIILLGGAWIGVPSMMAWHLMQESIEMGDASYEPIVTVLVAMTTATIAGTFLFMTFRIDRGTRLKAESVANRAVEDEVKNANSQLTKIENDAKRLLEDAKMDSRRHINEVKKDVERIRSTVNETVRTFLRKKFDEDTTPAKIRQEIEQRLTREALREHVEDVLLVDANLEMIEEYVRERAGDLDEATIERIVELMEELVKTWRGRAERETSRRGIVAAFFGKFRRSSRDA